MPLTLSTPIQHDNSANHKYIRKSLQYFAAGGNDPGERHELNVLRESLRSGVSSPSRGRVAMATRDKAMTARARSKARRQSAQSDRCASMRTCAGASSAPSIRSSMRTRHS